MVFYHSLERSMSEPFHFSAVEIARLHDRATRLWHDDTFNIVVSTGHPIYDAVLAQHRANFDLWHTEDRARAPQATDADIAEVKRAIDRYNQTRNDLAEQCDAMLLEALPSKLPNQAADLASESPGLMIDRLSILALKIFHTEEEIDRPNAPPGHTDRNSQRLALLEEQRNDLVACLDQLWHDVLRAKRRFKIYRQLKMYNDPTLNPAIYGSETE
jgi:hypothetical protein